MAYLAVWLLNDYYNYPETFGYRVLNNIWRVAYITFLNYLFFEYTLPRLRWKRIIRSILLVLGHILLYSWGLYAWRLFGIDIGFYTSLTTFESAKEGAAAQMSFSVSSLFFFGIIKHIYDHIRLRQAAQQLRLEKQEAELNYLKSQTNPHFLFNTLNNIYSLARDKSDLAPESILRLSKILRFMLYEAGGAYIAIEQELKILEDYIALEKLRYDESLQINLNHDIENMKQAIPPLLLIPLVENAFKHGVSETRNRPFVDIHLSVKNRQLLFYVKNSSETDPGAEMVKENIGLSNLRRQLELLYKDYELTVRQEKSTFIASLKINLASHV
jgi:LytS/YehU family sensor histidine kinase